MPTHCTGQVLWALHCLSRKLKCIWHFFLQSDSLWTVKHRAIHDIRPLMMHAFVVMCWDLSSKAHSSFCSSSKPCTTMPLVSCQLVCLLSHVSIHHNSTNTTMFEWTQTGTIHCHKWGVLCKCLNNQIHASLFYLAFCFHKHFTVTSLHPHWLLWTTHVPRQIMDCPLLHSVLLQLFVSHRPHHHSQGTLLLWFKRKVFQTLKWKRNEMMPNKKRGFLFITHCLVWMQFPVFLCFVAARLISLFSTHWYCSLLMRRERKEWIVHRCLLCVFCLHHPDRAQWVLCLISLIH